MRVAALGDDAVAEALRRGAELVDRSGAERSWPRTRPTSKRLPGSTTGSLDRLRLDDARVDALAAQLAETADAAAARARGGDVDAGRTASA